MMLKKKPPRVSVSAAWYLFDFLGSTKGLIDAVIQWRLRVD